MREVHTHNNGGIGFFGVLTIVFIVLKLTGTIGWSWWWVLAPIWIPTVVFFAIFTVGFGLFLVFGDKTKKRRWR